MLSHRCNPVGDGRRVFVVVDIIPVSAKESIQGVDLDFFQPRSTQERDNYLLFLQEALVAWRKEAYLKVSMTLHPHQKLPPKLYTYLDRIHLMAYDMMTHPTRVKTNDDPYHASLTKVRRAVEELLQQPGSGLDQTPHKILLGIPAYARHVQSPGQVKTFREIYDEVIQDDSYVVKTDSWDNLNSWEGYEWESLNRIKEKVKLAQEKGLGGVFFWEVGQDKPTADHPGGLLLETAAMAAHDYLMEMELSSSNLDEHADEYKRRSEL